MTPITDARSELDAPFAGGAGAGAPGAGADPGAETGELLPVSSQTVAEVLLETSAEVVVV
jgi:hypothetical protein